MSVAPIEVRSAALTDVRHPERLVELVAVPYDEWTQVEYQGRVIEESFAPGAFGHIGPRADRFIVNLEHDPARRVGRCVKLDPENRKGLMATVKIRRGTEGDETLDDAADGMVYASIGFGALPDHQHWEGRSRRRIVKAFLDHIALTWTPAYAGAGVLAVRSASATASTPSATPNLDAIRLQRLEMSYSGRQAF